MSHPFGPDKVATEHSQKRQTKRKEKRKSPKKVTIWQVIEAGHIVDELVDCEVDAIFFVKN